MVGSTLATPTSTLGLSMVLGFVDTTPAPPVPFPFTPGAQGAIAQTVLLTKEELGSSHPSLAALRELRRRGG